MSRVAFWFSSVLAGSALALLLATGGGAQAQGIDESQLLPVDEAFQLDAHAVSRQWIEFKFKVTPGYYLYRDRIKIEPIDAGSKFTPLHTPPGEFKEDPNFGRMEVYHNDFTAKLTGMAADGLDRLEFKVTYQGCADVGICYPPQRKQISVDLPAAEAGSAQTTADAAITASLDLAKPPSLLSSAPSAGMDMVGGSASISLGSTDALPLPPEQAFAFEAIAFSPTELLLRFTMAPGYYLYRDHSSFALSDASAGSLGVPRWPQARTVDDPEFGPVPVFYDLIEVPMTLARGSAQPHAVEFVAKFQGCEEGGVCYPPMTRLITLALPETSSAALAEAAARVEQERKDVSLSVSAFASAVDDQAVAPVNLWSALLLALLGGLVLNLMPCVLPVLSLKALSLAESGERPEQARKHALWYTAGVMSSFAAIGLLVIGLRAGGMALGWGFQLQQPVIVALMGYVMVVLGLSLSGVVTLGAGLSNLGSGAASRSGARGDFFTGVLACVVASPCTAPFMGTALAFAFAQSAWVALAIFLMLGLGLALPFLLVGFVPGLAHRLPKPGAWMETFKQWLAFPLYATAIWLVWVLGQQRGPDAMALWLAGALAVTAALWWWERGRYREGAVLRTVIVVVLFAVAAWALTGIHRIGPMVTSAASAQSALSEPYSAERLSALRAQGKPVFVNMTADWCLSCKLNERSTLSTDRFAELLKSTGTVYLKGDWTNEDPAISEFLKLHQAVGVPLYVFFPAAQGAPEKLPALLTPDLVAGVLR